MTMPRHPRSERIEEEASLWLARLEGSGGNLSVADRDALDAWLAAHVEHRRVFSRYHELSDQVGEKLNAQLDAAMEAVAAARALTRRRRNRLGSVVAIAAIVVIALTVALTQPQNFTTHTAQRLLSTLADGSRVELNAETSIAVKMGRDERRVRLVRGEALFSVAKDAVRPFVVETSTGVVRATGTLFNVRATRNPRERSIADGRVEVTVLEGSVRVRATGEPLTERAVASGGQAVIERELIVVRKLTDDATQGAVAWRQGQAVFENTSLREAIERFAAYHAREIIVDPKVFDLRLGGRYSLDDLDGLLESIEAVLPVRVSHGAGAKVRIGAAGADGG